MLPAGEGTEWLRRSLGRLELPKQKAYAEEKVGKGRYRAKSPYSPYKDRTREQQVYGL